eukprot:NODE_131_length_16689_cov_0.437914.p5 type:complete len:209 gc:universal NODE_131_length_16689_cov_0.437914:10706-11332(+)
MYVIWHQSIKNCLSSSKTPITQKSYPSHKSMVIKQTASPVIVTDYYTLLPAISPVTPPRDFLLKIKYWDPVNYKAKIEPVPVTLKSDDCTIKSILDRHIPQEIKMPKIKSIYIIKSDGNREAVRINCHLARITTGQVIELTVEYSAPLDRYFTLILEKRRINVNSTCADSLDSSSLKRPMTTRAANTVYNKRICRPESSKTVFVSKIK